MPITSAASIVTSGVSFTHTQVIVSVVSGSPVETLDDFHLPRPRMMTGRRRWLREIGVEIYVGERVAEEASHVFPRATISRPLARLVARLRTGLRVLWSQDRGLVSGSRLRDPDPGSETIEQRTRRKL